MGQKEKRMAGVVAGCRDEAESASPVREQSTGQKPVGARVIDMQPSLQHDFFQITGAERITKVPPYTEQNDVGLEVAPFKRVLLSHNASSFFFLSANSNRAVYFLQQNPLERVLFLHKNVTQIP
jgi:hypothetical protein